MKYINTIEYGQVKVRYNKLYTLNFVDLVDIANDGYYSIYTNWNGELVAIKEIEE